jgi:DICT domain-containing protein/predicted DNA-binding transcriptional regulator AlpA
VTSAPGDASRPPASLTIGDLATRTGLSPATLRAWETRHDFPRPTRLESGHRRYGDADVAAVLQVLRSKAAGVRLEHAIADAVAVRRGPTASIFAELRRAAPHLSPVPLRKSTLLALTWAMEDECCARAEQPTLFAAFQLEEHYRHAEARWEELDRTSRRTVVFADFADGVRADATKPGGRGPTLVHLPDEAPMRREWSLVCDAVDHPSALAAWELPGQRGVRDRDRVFESLWTLEPAGVRSAARACADLVEQLVPDRAGTFTDLDQTPSSVPSTDLRAATNLFTRLIGYVDKTS